MKITKETLKQLIKEEFSPGQRRNALERLIRDAAEDALKQGKGPEDIGLMVVDMLAKAGVNLDPRRNLLDPKTTDPDAQNMQKVVNKYELSKMATPKALEESKKGEFGKMKITKQKLVELVQEVVAEKRVTKTSTPQDYFDSLGSGPRKGAMSELPGSTRNQRQFSQRSAELESDIATHGMDVNPYQALGDAAAEGSDVALDKLIRAASRDPDAAAILRAVVDETGMSLGSMSIETSYDDPSLDAFTPAEREAAALEESKKGEFGKMKITNSVIKDLIREYIEEQDDVQPSRPPELETRPFDMAKAKKLLKKAKYVISNYSAEDCPADFERRRLGLSGLVHDLRRLVMDARRDKNLDEAKKNTIIGVLRKHIKALDPIVDGCP